MTHAGPQDAAAAIDCGTNSIKLLIGSSSDVVLRTSRVVRLGQGVDEAGMLTDEALARTFAAVEEFAAIIADLDIPSARIRFCATSATRDARNSALFTEGVRRRLGVEPEVLSGDEEAALVYAGAVSMLPQVPAEPVLVVDIGGGSTELVLGQGGPRQSISMDIGSVRLHERHLHSDPPTAAEIADCVSVIDRHLDESGIPIRFAKSLVGTSGTIKTIACGVLDAAAYDRRAFDLAELDNSATRAFCDRILHLSVAERVVLPYMHPGRADVVGAGALIWSRILARVQIDTHLVSEADILNGILAGILTAVSSGTDPESGETS